MTRNTRLLLGTEGRRHELAAAEDLAADVTHLAAQDRRPFCEVPWDFTYLIFLSVPENTDGSNYFRLYQCIVDQRHASYDLSDYTLVHHSVISAKCRIWLWFV